MTQDYPDYTRLFHLVGTNITIPINIEAIDVTLPVSIVDASGVTFDVNITAIDVTMPVSIDAVTVTIDVNVAAQAANFTIEFADQSVAVFDAAKWFAHNAQQWSVPAGDTLADGSFVKAERVVPTGKAAFVCGISLGYQASGASGCIFWAVLIGGVNLTQGSYNIGGGLIFDVPFRATVGQTISLQVCNLSGAPKRTTCSIWGYDETV